MSSTVYDITFTTCVTSHNACISDITHSVYDISTLYGITCSVMKTQTLCNFTATMSDITTTLSVSSHPLDRFYQTQCMYDIAATICMTSYAHVTSHSQFRTSHHFMYDIRSTLSYLTSTVFCLHTRSIDDITATVCMTSHPVFV